MTIYSLDVLLSQFGSSPLFHVWFELLLLDLHTDFSGGRSGGLVFSSLEDFPVCCDPHCQRLWYIQWSRSRCFSGILFLFYDSVDVAIWSLVPLPFLNETWTSGSSCFTYCWSLAGRILSITLLECEMSAIVQWFEHSLALPFFETALKTDLFQSCSHCLVFQSNGQSCIPLTVKSEYMIVHSVKHMSHTGIYCT